MNHCTDGIGVGAGRRRDQPPHQQQHAEIERAAGDAMDDRTSSSSASACRFAGAARAGGPFSRGCLGLGHRSHSGGTRRPLCARFVADGRRCRNARQTHSGNASSSAGRRRCAGRLRQNCFASMTKAWPLIMRLQYAFCVGFLRKIRRLSRCASISPISACSATWWRPAASPTAPSAPIWRWPPPRPASATWSRRWARRCWCAARQGVTPTQAGRTLLQHARTMLAQAERLREDLGAYAGGLAGQVRVLSNTNALTEFLPEALSSFLAAHPNVSVDLEERLSDEIVGLIAEGVGDIGIVAGTVDAGGLTHLSVPQRPLRAGGGARPSARAALADRLRRGARPRFRRPRPRQRDAALPRRQGEPHRPAAAAARAVAQLRRGLPAGRVQCRRRHRAGDHARSAAERNMAIKAVDLTDPWALRELTICVRDFDDAAALCAPAGGAHARQRANLRRRDGMASTPRYAALTRRSMVLKRRRSRERVTADTRRSNRCHPRKHALDWRRPRVLAGTFAGTSRKRRHATAGLEDEPAACR